MKRTAAFERHGRNSSDPTYAAWLSMKSRCKNPKNENYLNYGGRGITVCEAWDKSFLQFLADMGDRPDGKSLERDNVNGNYEPNNCRWATMQEQQENRRNSRPISVNGVEYPTIAAACKALGMKINTVHNRLNRGVAPEDAFRPALSRSQRNSKAIVVAGIRYESAREAISAYSIDARTYYRRIKSGMTPEQALEVE